MTEFRPTRFESLPTVIKNLLIINVLCYVAQLTMGSHGVFSMEDTFALHHVRSPLFRPWQLVTHMFLHGGWLHLAFNMFGLWMFGSILESLWGPKRFLTFYLLCGLGAAILYLASLWFEFRDLINDFYFLKMHASPDELYRFYTNYSLNYDATAVNLVNNSLHYPGNATFLEQAVSYTADVVNAKISSPTVGASGAVFGVLAAFVYLFPNTDIYAYFIGPIKAKWFGLFYFGYEILMAVLNRPDDHVAHWAHIGGGIVGFLLVLTWNKDRKRFY